MWYQQYVGTPFVEKGRDAKGLDCWGLVRLVYMQERKILLPDYLELYESTNDRELLSEIISTESGAHWEAVVDSPQPFDVAILKMMGVPMHVGVVTKPNHIIHCAQGIGTTHEHLGTARWKHRVVGFVRWKN